jgi:hypothetical protein
MIWPLPIWHHVEGPASAIIIRQLTGENDKTHEDSWLVAEFRSSNLPNMMRQWHSLRHGAQTITAIQYLRRSLWPLHADEESNGTNSLNTVTSKHLGDVLQHVLTVRMGVWHIGHQKGSGCLVGLDVHGTVSCENCKEPPSSVKCGKFLVLQSVEWLIGWLVSATYPSLFSKVQNTIPSRIFSQDCGFINT